jgi:hypothetical protein
MSFMRIVSFSLVSKSRMSLRVLDFSWLSKSSYLNYVHSRIDSISEEISALIDFELVWEAV